MSREPTRIGNYVTREPSASVEDLSRLLAPLDSLQPNLIHRVLHRPHPDPQLIAHSSTTHLEYG